MKKLEQATRNMSLSGLRKLPPEAPNTLLLTRMFDYTKVEIYSECFNIVLSRDVRRNTQLAAEVAIDIAADDPRMDVIYINTFAGLNLLKQSFAKAMENSGVEEMDEDALPNLSILDFPLGEWSTKVIAENIESHGRETAPTVLVMNAFEFSALTRGTRARVARELLKLRDEYALTILIFSQEMRRDLAPGLAGRGAVGMIAPRALTVSRLLDPFEHLYGSKQAEKPDVHEKITHINDILGMPALDPEEQPEELEPPVLMDSGEEFERQSPKFGTRMPDRKRKLYQSGTEIRKDRMATA